MLVHGLVKESELINLDPRARQQLGTRFTFDRERSPQAGVLMHPRGIYRKSANYTVTADDNGLLFLATAAVTFTLPTKENGLAFRFVQTADANLVISGSADIIAQERRRQQRHVQHGQRKDRQPRARRVHLHGRQHAEVAGDESRGDDGDGGVAAKGTGNGGQGQWGSLLLPSPSALGHLSPVPSMPTHSLFTSNNFHRSQP